MEWQRFFEGVPDFRLERRKRHKLGDILMLSLCAVLSGADDFEDMETYGRQKEAFLRQFLELPNGIPSHDTINRVYNRLDKDKFGECLHRWSRELLDFFGYYQLNVDGKVLRGTGQSGSRNAGICLVSAWAQQQRLVLGQRKTQEKSNEKTHHPRAAGEPGPEGGTGERGRGGLHRERGRADHRANGALPAGAQKEPKAALRAGL